MELRIIEYVAPERAAIIAGFNKVQLNEDITINSVTIC